MPKNDSASTLANALAASLTVTEPAVAGPLAVFPLIAASAPSVGYLSFAEGLRQGLVVKELEGGARVNDLVVHNPLAAPVLIYEGQEVLGAQQNRTFDVSVFVSPASSVGVPVSCVEAGRWDGRRRGDAFRLAPQAAYPELRRVKNVRIREQIASAMKPRARQDEVWDELADKSERHGVRSTTGAMHDVFEGERARLEAAAEHIEMKCSQVGMLAAIGGKFVVLDYVSDVEAFADLHAALVQGYALDALEHVGESASRTPSLEDAKDFVDLLLAAAPTSTPAVGTGDAICFEFGLFAGTGLRIDTELVALTAFQR